MNNFKSYEHYTKLIISNDEIEKIEKTIGYTTVWNLQKQYGISKLKINRALNSQKINGFMKEETDKYGKKYIVLKWYIVCDRALERFIEKIKISILKN